MLTVGKAFFKFHQVFLVLWNWGKSAFDMLKEIYLNQFFIENEIKNYLEWNIWYQFELNSIKSCFKFTIKRKYEWCRIIFWWYYWIQYSFFWNYQSQFNKKNNFRHLNDFISSVTSNRFLFNISSLHHLLHHHTKLFWFWILLKTVCRQLFFQNLNNKNNIFFLQLNFFI